MDTCGREQILEIYALNDVHGRFFNTPHYAAGSRVSLANASTFIKGRRDFLGPDKVLLLDCGDNLQGDMAVCRSNRRVREGLPGHIYPQVARFLGIDAAVPGNHDFEAGPLVFGRVVEELEGSGIPVLGANVLREGAGEPAGFGGEPFFTPYAIFCRDGLRVAVIGLANPCTPRWIPKQMLDGMAFVAPLQVAGRLVDEIRRDNLADMVVLALHSGFGEPDTDISGEGGVVQEHQALALARELHGVDIIFAGHDHKQGCCRVGDTLVMSASSHASGLQRAVVRVEKDGGKVVGKRIVGEIVQLEDIAEDEGYLGHFGEEIGEILNEMDRVVGKLEVEIDAREALWGQCGYLNLLHSVQLEVSGAQVSFASPYMYDSVVGAGEVLWRDVFQMYSAENTLFKIWMTGRQIKDYLEYSYGKWVCDAGEGHVLQLCSTELDGKRYWWPENFTYNFDSAAGLVYTVDITRAAGERVEIVSLWSGEPFDLEGRYTVALSSYRVSGGGGLLDCGAGIDLPGGVEEIVAAGYTFIRDLLEEFIARGRGIDEFRCGHWEFVPPEEVVPARERDMQLLFGRQ